MLKMLAAVLLSMMLSSSSMIAASPPFDPGTAKLLATAPEDASVRLYLTGPNPSDGIFHGAWLQIGDQRHWYAAWSGSADPAAAPQLYYTDVTGDGSPEAVVILTLASGTGVELQDIHLVNPQTLQEYPVESAMAYVQQHVSSLVKLQGDRQLVNMSLTIDGTLQTFDKPISAFYDDPSHFTDHLDFSSFLLYDTEKHDLRATVSGSVSPSEFVGDLELRYVYEHGQFNVDSIRFVPEP